MDATWGPRRKRGKVRKPPVRSSYQVYTPRPEVTADYGAFGDLVKETEKVFAFLHDLGCVLVDTKMVWPNSFRGGFILTYESGAVSIRVEYLEAEFKVERDGEELFGPSELGPFAGIMFSSGNLPNCLDRIAAHVRFKLEQVES